MRVSLKFSRTAYCWLIAGAACAPPYAASQSGTQITPSPAAQSAGNQVGITGGSQHYAPIFFAKMNAKTALDMVNLLPGFTFSAGDTAARGYSASAGNVLIDGQRPSNKQFPLDTVLQNIAVSQVDYLEVIEGSRPGLDMLGQTVVANVVLKRGLANATILTQGNGFFLDGRYTPSGSLQVTRQRDNGQTLTGAFSMSRYVELAEGNGPQTRTDANGAVLQRASVLSAAGGLTAYTYGVFTTPSWHGSLTLNGSAARTDYSYSEDDTADTQSALLKVKERLGGPLGGQFLSEFGAHFSRGFGEKLKSETVVLIDPTWQKYSSTSVAPGAEQTFAERQSGGETLARSNLRYVVASNVTFEANAEFAYNWLETLSTYAYNGTVVPLPNASANVNEKRGQAFAHIAWTPRKGLDLDFGAQGELSKIGAVADADQSRLLTYFKPRFAASFSPSLKLRLSARVEHEVGQLNFTDFVAVSSLSTGSIRAGNTDIVPQQDWVCAGALERHFWSEGDLALTYRHYFISDALDRVPIEAGSSVSATFDAPGNIGTGNEDVLILNATVPVHLRGASRGQFRATATRLWSRVTDPTTGVERPLTGLDPFEYSLTFRDDISHWKADWGVALLTPCSASTTAKGCTKAQFRFNEVDSYRATPAVNAFAEYLPSRKLSIRLEADNVLHQQYNRLVRIYGGPRNTSPLTYQEQRRLTSSASFVLSLRKTF